MLGDISYKKFANADISKTIEVGMVLSEMRAENKRNILIVVPASLRNQWNMELMEKFYHI